MLPSKTMPVMPDYLSQSMGIQKLAEKDKPVTDLRLYFENPSMDGFLEAYEAMIDSGKLFKYEDYNYVDNGNNVVNNLRQCKNLYQIDDFSKWHFLRRERIKTGQNLNFTIYNANVGFFPEIEQSNPGLVELITNVVEHLEIQNVFKILIFKMDQDLVWHQDMDGYYGFRVFLGHDDWTLKFRKIKPEYRNDMEYMTWQGKWNEVNESVPEMCYPEDIVYTAKDVSKVMLINSMDYVHYFENTKPMWGVFIKGVI